MKLLIFDWDGTLSDSASKIIYSVQEAAKQINFPILSDDEVKNIIGLGLPEAIAHLYPDSCSKQRKLFRDAYVKNFLSSQHIESPLFDGVEQGLSRLKESGFLLGVATGKSRRGLNRVLSETALEPLFSATRCADETASKPNPLMLQQLLEEFKIKPELCAMIGDTEYDMAMAQALGVHRIAVSYGAHSVKRLRAYEPLLLVNEFSELVDWLLDVYQE